MTTNVSNIQIGVNLIDDYLYTELAPVAPDLNRDQFVVVQNPASKEIESELLTVNSAGQLVHFWPDSSSNSGWNCETVVLSSIPNYTANPDASTAINRLVGFYHKGTLNVLCYYPLQNSSGSSAAWLQLSSDGTWAQAILSNSAQNALGFTYQTDQYIDANSNVYLYGVSGNISPNPFFIVTYVEDPGQNKSYWDIIWEQFPAQFSPELEAPQNTAFRMTPGSDGNDTATIIWVANNAINYQEATITWTQESAAFAWNGNSSTYKPNLGTLTADNVYAMPGDYGDDNLILLDTEGTLYLVQGYKQNSVSMTALTGAEKQPVGAAAVSAGIDSNNTLNLFIIEAQSEYLWYVQQQGSGATATLTFNSWVNLGGSLNTIGCPMNMRAGPELFKVDVGQTVYHMDQSLSDQVWSPRELAKPSASTSSTDEPTRIASYSMEISALNGSTPVSKALLSVTADQATTIIWNQIAYPVGPNNNATIQVDGSGQATVLYQSDSLKPPILTFTANCSGVTRWCQGDVVQVKSTETALPPLSDSVAPQLQSITGDTLINQGFVGTDYNNQEAADNAAKAINATGQWMNNNAQDPDGSGSIDLSRIETAHWKLDFRHPDGPRFSLLSEAEARLLVIAANDRNTPALLGGVLGDVFGDVAHFFKHEWQKLDSFAATVDQGVLKVILTAEQGSQAFVIATVKQAGAALETIFSKIKEAAEDIYGVIKDIIAFLKMLFDWDDILNTHNVMKECVTQTLTNLSGSIEYAQTLVDNEFSTLQAEVKNIFQNLENNFESIKGQSYNDFVDNTAGSQNSLAGTATQNAQQQHASKCNYVYSRSKPSFSGPSAIPLQGLVGALGGTDPTTPISNAVKQYIYSGNPEDQTTQTFNAASAKLNDFITTNISDPSAFFDLVILDLLTAAEDLVLFIIDGIEYVINEILSVALTAIDAFTTMITATIDIPIISWLWKNVITHGDDLTLLDLVCLIFAVPATILYKLIGSKLLQPNEAVQAPFSSSDATTIKNTGLPWPTIPSQIGVAEETPVAEGSQLPSLLLANLYLCSGFFLTFSAGFNAAGDYLAWQDQQSESDEPDPLIKLVSLLGIIPRLATFGTCAPVSILEKPRDQWSDADQWTMWLWSARGCAALTDVIYTAVSVKKAESKWIPVIGPALKTALGVTLEGIGGVASYYQLQNQNYSDWVPANDWIRPTASCFKFLMYFDAETPVWTPFPWLLGIDVVAGIGSSVTQIGGTVYKYQHSS